MGKKQAAQQTEESTAQKSAVTVNRKLTVKDIVGAIIMAHLPPLGEEVKLCKIVGYASGTKSGTTQYGEWHALTGEFAATNYETGEIFVSKNAIIPGAMGDALVDTVTDKLSQDASSKVAFAVDVFVKRSARQPDTKYEYVVRPIMDAQISSPAMALLEMSA